MPELRKFVIPIPKKFMQYVRIKNELEGGRKGWHVIMRFEHDLGASLLHTQHTHGVEVMPAQWGKNKGLDYFEQMSVTLLNYTDQYGNPEVIRRGSVYAEATPQDVLEVLSSIKHIDEKRGMEEARELEAKEKKQKAKHYAQAMLSAGKITAGVAGAQITVNPISPPMQNLPFNPRNAYIYSDYQGETYAIDENSRRWRYDGLSDRWR